MYHCNIFLKMKSFAILFLPFCLTANAFAQKIATDTTNNKEPLAVAEIGAAGSKDIKGTGSSFGYSLAVEVTPIEDWLELELGVSPTFAKQYKELDADLLFKKPWTLSSKVEFMFGLGIAWDHVNKDNVITNVAGVEAAFDFMFWPGAKHRFGWYMEPAYQYDFGVGHEQSVGMSAGLLVGIP